MAQQFIDQRDIDAQNWGAERYAAHQAEIRADGNAAVLSFAIFVIGALAFVGVLAYAVLY